MGEIFMINVITIRMIISNVTDLLDFNLMDQCTSLDGRLFNALVLKSCCVESSDECIKMYM